MKSNSISNLKKELTSLPAGRVIDICISLAKYKKDNKEFLTYLLFDAADEGQYINGLKSEMDEMFKQLNLSNTYIAKKSVRKILRLVQKHIKFSGNKKTEAELLIYYCSKLKASGLPLESSTALASLFSSQFKKANSAIESLHEDLQHDYKEELFSIFSVSGSELLSKM